MSEEEIIDKINLYLRYADVFFEIPGRNNVVKTIKGLLDLYQKEKEKNIKLTNTIKYLNEEKERNKELLNEKESVFDKGYFEGTKDGEETIRDEIRAKIKDLEDIIEFEKPTYKDTLEYTIDILKELLEENKSNENNI